MIKPKRLQPSSEMNITPMIDVLLVLLVIFMAALPRVEIVTAAMRSGAAR